MSKGVILLIALLIVVIHGASLLLVPAPFCDEFWFLARTVGFLKTGYPFGPLDEGVFDQIAGHQHFFGVIPHIFFAPIVAWLGPTFIAMRVVTVLIGLYLLFIVYLIFNKVVSKRMALVGTSLLSLSVPFFISSHLARLDIMAVAFILTSTLLLLSSTKFSYLSAFAAGLLVILGYDCHPHSFVIIPPMLILVFQKTPSFKQFIERTMIFSFGALVGGVLFYFWHIYPDPAGFFRLTAIAFAPSHLPPLVTLNSSVLYEAIWQMPHIFERVLPFWEWVFLAGLIVGLTCKESRKALLVFLVSVAAYTLLIRHKSNAYYFIYFAPFLYLFIAKILDEWSLARKRFKSALFYQSIFVLILAPVALQVFSMLKNLSWAPYQGYLNTIAHIQSEVRPDDTILGPQTFWSAEMENKYYSWEGLVYFRRAFPGTTLKDAFLKFRPSIIIIDSNFRSKLISESEAPQTSPYLSLPKEEMAAILKEHTTSCTRAFSPFDPNGIEIVKLNW